MSSLSEPWGDRKHYSSFFPKGKRPQAPLKTSCLADFSVNFPYGTDPGTAAPACPVVTEKQKRGGTSQARGGTSGDHAMCPRLARQPGGKQPFLPAARHSPSWGSQRRAGAKAGAHRKLRDAGPRGGTAGFPYEDPVPCLKPTRLCTDQGSTAGAECLPCPNDTPGPALASSPLKRTIGSLGIVFRKKKGKSEINRKI